MKTFRALQLATRVCLFLFALLPLITPPTAVAQQVLFEDNFNNGTWKPEWVSKMCCQWVQHGWLHSRDTDGWPRDSMAVVHDGDQNWKDYTLSLKGQFVQMPYLPNDFTILVRTVNFVRSSEQHTGRAYQIIFNGRGHDWTPNQVVLVRSDYDNGSDATLVTQDFLLPLDPMELKITVEGPRIQLWIDSELVFDVTDPDPFLYGGVGVHAIWETEARFDDVVVSEPGGCNEKIAIMVNAYFAGSEAGLYTISPDGSKLKKLLSVPPSPHGGGPAKWSPDGKKIAFDAEFGGNDEIYVINADGTSLRQLTFDPAEDRDPTWSPDGARIVFSSNRGGMSQHDLFVMNADGSNIVNLTNSPTSGEYQPDWSPNGTKIVFDSYASGSGTQDVWIMNVDGSGQTDLTPNTEASFDGAARWSTDGTKLVFGSTRTGDGEVFVMNPDGTAVTDLTNNSADEFRGDWSPRGIKIAFESERSGTSGVYTMNADGTGQKAIFLPNTLDALWLDVQKR